LTSDFVFGQYNPNTSIYNILTSEKEKGQKDKQRSTKTQIKLKIE
jgi:hypothetical protein